jgi:hypothetical protein
VGLGSSELPTTLGVAVKGGAIVTVGVGVGDGVGVTVAVAWPASRVGGDVQAVASRKTVEMSNKGQDGERIV